MGFLSDYVEYFEEEISKLEQQEPEIEIGTCQGCGGYGKAGTICIRNGEECGEYL